MRLPAHIQNLPPYVPGETLPALAARLGLDPARIVKLDSNENPYGPPAAVRRALANLAWPERYPDTAQTGLRAALAAYTGVPADFLLAGNGSDDLLALLSQVLLEPGDRVLVCPPTFPMYALYAGLNGARGIEVPRRPDFSLDVEAVLAAAQEHRPKIVFVDHPGNPGGTLVPAADLERLLALPSLLVLDEAYIEFAGVESMMPRVPGRDNLVVTRTFSKWAGLAGFRIGYGAFPSWLLPALWTARSPYAVTAPALAAALAALGDLPTLQRQVEQIITDRRRLADSLDRFPFLTASPSAANFILARVDPASGRTATQVCEALKERGILVRLFAGIDCLRVTVGTPEQIEALLAALEEITP